MESLNSLAIQPNVFYTVEETAQLLRASQPSVLRLLRSGTVRGVKVSLKRNPNARRPNV